MATPVREAIPERNPSGSPTFAGAVPNTAVGLRTRPVWPLLSGKPAGARVSAPVAGG